MTGELKAGRFTSAGTFEVIAITEGSGNGWSFSAACLKDSLPLWEGVECFVDHGSEAHLLDSGMGRSVRDLAGVFHNPRWDETSRGVLLDLQTLGPSSALLEAVGRQVLDSAGSGNQDSPRVGFSADLLFTAEGKSVTQIVKILTLDLVMNPARGGAFVRALNQDSNHSYTRRKTGGAYMEAENQSRTQSQGMEGEAVRVQMCQYLLESGLASARLPQAAEHHVRRQFEGRSFEPAELNEAINSARKLVSDLTGGSVIAGPGRVNAMFNSGDQLQAAVDDLLNAPREHGMEALRSSRLSGIKELYMLMTGDRDLYGGYYGERVQLATTASFTGLVKNAMNKIVAEQWEQLGAAGYDWWRRVVSVEHFESLNQITGVLVGTVGALPSIAEGGEYTELKIGDSPETASFNKYGGYIPLTLELIDRDDTRKLRQYPRELAKAGIRKISSLVAEVFSANSGVGPTLADGGALFNSTAVTTAGGHKNLRTCALASAEWEAVKQAMYAQPMLIANETGYTGLGAPSAIKPRYLLAPITLELTAKKILYGSWENNANIHAENFQRQADGDVVIVPEWTDANDWAAAADPRILPGIIVGERFGLMPEVFIAGDETSPAVFMNDEHRIKVRHYVAVLVQDFRAMHKNNV
jgi:hypothetical protein